MVAAERRDPSRRRVFIMCGFTKHMIMPSVFCVMGASPQSGGKSAFPKLGGANGDAFYSDKRFLGRCSIVLESVCAPGTGTGRSAVVGRGFTAAMSSGSDSSPPSVVTLPSGPNFRNGLCRRVWL